MSKAPSLRIISTRPAHQAAAWVARIQQVGLEVKNLPTLNIVPVKETQALNRIQVQLQKLNEYEHLIFVSQNAVRYGCDWIDEYWPQYPIGVKGLAVGAKTLEALRDRFDEWGVANDGFLPQLCQPTFDGMNSEELLASPELLSVQDKKVLIFRGCGGRTMLMDTLQARGAKVEHCEVYHRELPEESFDLCRTLNIKHSRDIATLFSGESLENFTTLVKSASVESWESIPIVVPSVRVKTMAEGLGYQKIEVAENATEDAMWKALKNVLP